MTKQGIAIGVLAIAGLAVIVEMAFHSTSEPKIAGATGIVLQIEQSPRYAEPMEETNLLGEITNVLNVANDQFLYSDVWGVRLDSDTISSTPSNNFTVNPRPVSVFQNPVGVSFGTVSGMWHAVECSGDGITWRRLNGMNYFGDGSVISLPDSSTEEKRFYRVFAWRN